MFFSRSKSSLFPFSTYTTPSILLNLIKNHFQTARTSKKPVNRIMFNVIIEGNIGSGKTSLIEYFKKNNSKQIMTLLEPIEKWRNLRGENLFDLMKVDPVKYALPFQQLIQLTMAETHSQQPENEFREQRIKLMERSLFSARYVFVENLYRMKLMNKVEYNVYDEWYKYLINDLSNKISVDLILYLKTDPQVCLERIKQRDRKEETKISIDYLKQLDSLHENWLYSEETRPAPVLTIPGNGSKAEMHDIFQLITPFLLGQRPLPVLGKIDLIDLINSQPLPIEGSENVRIENVAKKLKPSEVVTITN